MRVHTLERTQRLPGTPERLFAILCDPGLLDATTPALLRVRVLTPPPPALGTGAVVHYAMRLHGVPLRWVTSIQAFDPPRRFADVQLRGPFAFWHHAHVLAPAGPEVTAMTDTIRYAVGRGPLGPLADRLLVRRDLATILDFRAAVLPTLVRARLAG